MKRILIFCLLGMLIACASQEDADPKLAIKPDPAPTPAGPVDTPNCNPANNTLDFTGGPLGLKDQAYSTVSVNSSSRTVHADDDLSSYGDITLTFARWPVTAGVYYTCNGSPFSSTEVGIAINNQVGYFTTLAENKKVWVTMSGGKTVITFCNQTVDWGSSTSTATLRLKY
jgi:hypothetical protein